MCERCFCVILKAAFLRNAISQPRFVKGGTACADGFNTRYGMTDTTNLKKQIAEGTYDSYFERLYGDAERAFQKQRYTEVIEGFEKRFGEATVAIFSAPGRTEICGNHTDHQNGRVITAAVDLDVVAVVAMSGDDNVRMYSEGYDETVMKVTDTDINTEEYGTTKALIKGMVAASKARGYKTGGFNAYVRGGVPGGSGLSSSAAFEVLTGTIINGLFNDFSIDPETIAVMGREAENRYFGKPCGLMDQMGCSVGGMIKIDLADPDNAVIQRIDTDITSFGYSLCIVDTKGSHADLTGEYASVFEEMRSVAKYLGKDLLGETDEEMFKSNIAALRDALGDRAVLRALHWYNENRRVDRMAKALKAGDIDGFLACVKGSGDSSYRFLQNVYAVKNPKEQAVALALAFSEEILGSNGVCRVHGGGFAGTIQAFVKNTAVADYKERIEDIFGEGSCYVLRIRSVGGIMMK